LERARAEGREQGKQEAHDAAVAMAQASVAPTLQGMKGMLKELVGEKEKTRKLAEKDVVQLAIAIARRVLRRELSTDPEAILGLVKSAFEKMSARETHKLRVSLADSAVLEANRAVLDFPPALQLVPDGSLPQGSVVFETTRGQMDASVDTQLVEIERGLADLLQRRSR